MDKAPTGGMSYDVTTGGHIRQVSVFAKFMKLDRNPPQVGVFLEWVMGTYQIGISSGSRGGSEGSMEPPLPKLQTYTQGRKASCMFEM